jgi:phosphoribosyl-AMP cyclohydrolase / phosphoribosyl-ATP pyrophosphohydrolase
MEIDFEKNNGLVPAIIQDVDTHQVLMLGYMNREAWEKTLAEKRVTFFSRSRNTLWTKGETSGHFLKFIDAKTDCDHDTLLIRVVPEGPVCHLGTDTCWGEENRKNPADFLMELQSLLRERKRNRPEGSYTVQLLDAGIKKIAQKVGEEAVETILEAENGTTDRFLSESADLIYHFITLLVAKDLGLESVIRELKDRRK